MEVIITQGGEEMNFDPRGISQSKQEDWKAIKLNKDGKVYVVHVILADNLIKAKKAVEAKGVKFELGEPHIKFVSEVKDK